LGIETTADGFAVNGDDFRAGVLFDIPHPGREALLNGCRAQAIETVSKLMIRLLSAL
jgi:hypothetical protein